MKYLNGYNYVGVIDQRYKIHPTENIILRRRNSPTSLRTQYQVQNETQIRRNQKVIKIGKDELVVKNYSKFNKQPIQQQQKFKLPNCPSCKRNNWLEFDKGFYCQNCEYIINKQKHQIIKEVRRQDRDFSSRLIYANKKISHFWMNMVNTSTEDVIDKLQQLKGKTKLNFYKNINNYFNEMKHKNFQTQEDPFSKNAQGISNFYLEVLLLTIFLETKSEVKNMNIKYYDLYYTVLKNRDEKEIVDNQYENVESDVFSSNEFIIPNHYVGIRHREK